jgi:sulfite exporter TauE/SafE
VTPDLLLAAGTGLLGGFGHCAAMCGPIVASLTVLSAPRRGQGRAVLEQLLYNAGRVTTYACVGAMMGLTGSFVNTAGRLAGLQQVVAVLAGLLMVAMGIGAAGPSAWLRRLEERATAPVRRAVGIVLEGGGIGRSYALGLLLGFLPCGLSYSAFLGAAATGGLPQGLLFALSFALGTVPALLAVGVASTLLSARLRGVLYRLGGAAVAVLGVLFVARGLGLHAAL